MNALDFDQDVLDRLKPTCARLQTSTRVGSGFLVDPRRLVTCWHVVDDLDPDEPVTCTFGARTRETRHAKVVAHDASADIAVLELDAPVDAAPLRLGTRADAPEWTTFGYPAYMEGAGLTCRGHVNDWYADAPGHDDVIALLSAQFDRTALGGISGSPVVGASREIVGMIFCVLGTDGERKIPHQGVCYAVPVRRFPHAILEALGVWAPSKPARAGPTSPITDAAQMRTGAEYVELARAETASAIREKLGRSPPEILALLGTERLIAMNELAEARLLLEALPDSPRRSELMALTFSFEGKHAEAQKCLRGVSTPEAGSIRGGIFKRRWVETRDRAWLEAAYDAYATTFAYHPKHYYSGINVASVALLLGERDEAKNVARKVLELTSNPLDHWELATRAEALSILGEFEQARELYARAASGAAERDVAVMQAQAQRNLGALGEDPTRFDRAFLRE